MGKIYDALKRAENEAKMKRGGDESAGQPAPAIPAAQTASEREAARDTKIAPPSLQVLPESADLERKAVAPFALKGVSDKKAKRVPTSLPATLIALSAPQSPEAEQFRILKSRVLSFCKEKELRTLLITSCLPEEGKSTVAANLSVCIANGVNDRALLLDCDLRRPSIHKVFNLNRHSRGLADYLVQESLPLQKVIHASGIDKLTIIPAGTIPDNPSELLSSNKMIELLQEVKAHYGDRYIVLDSTPAHQTPEPATLSRYVDGVVLVVRAGKTGRDTVTRVVESLGRNKIIGVVFNMVSEPVRSYYYNYNSYYSKKTDD